MDNPSPQLHPYHRYGLARRLVVYILFFSSLVTLLATWLQLYMDYSRDMEQIHHRTHEVETSHIPNIINNVWLTQMDSVRLEMDGILRLPDMHSVAITLEGGEEIFLGKRLGEDLLVHRYPLWTTFRGQKVHLGEFTVTASLSGVYERLWDKVVLILATQAIKTFLVSFFILWLFYVLVGRHLHGLAEYTLGLRLNNLAHLPPLPYCPLSPSGRRDELGQLFHAVGTMVEHLAITYQQIQANNQTLEDKILQLRQTEAALQQNQQRLQEERDWAQAHLNMVAGIFVQIDLQGQVVVINTLGAAILGQPVETIVGKRWIDHFVEPTMQEELQQSFPHLFADGASSDLLAAEYGVVTSLGLQQQFIWNHRLLQNGSGQVTAILSHGMDISERKRAEMKLSASEARLRSIIDNSQAIIFLKDIHGYYQQVNKRFLTFFDLTADQVIGKSDYHFMPNEVANIIRKNDMRALESGSYESEEQVYSGQGIAHTFLAMKFPLLDGEGPPYALCGIATDISEQKRVQWALERELVINQTMVQLARMMIQPTTTLSHIARQVLDAGLALTNSSEGYVSRLSPLNQDNLCIAHTEQIQPEGEILFGMVNGLYPEPLGASLNQKRSLFYYDITPEKSLGLLSVPMSHWLTVPILAGERLVGQIAMVSPYHSYGPQEVKSMEMLAELFAVAIQHEH